MWSNGTCGKYHSCFIQMQGGAKELVWLRFDAPCDRIDYIGLDSDCSMSLRVSTYAIISSSRRSSSPLVAMDAAYAIANGVEALADLTRGGQLAGVLIKYLIYRCARSQAHITVLCKFWGSLSLILCLSQRLSFICEYGRSILVGDADFDTPYGVLLHAKGLLLNLRSITQACHGHARSNKLELEELDALFALQTESRISTPTSLRQNHDKDSQEKITAELAESAFAAPTPPQIPQLLPTALTPSAASPSSAGPPPPTKKKQKKKGGDLPVHRSVLRADLNRCQRRGSGTERKPWWRDDAQQQSSLVLSLSPQTRDKYDPRKIDDGFLFPRGLHISICWQGQGYLMKPIYSVAYDEPSFGPWRDLQTCPIPDCIGVRAATWAQVFYSLRDFRRVWKAHHRGRSHAFSFSKNARGSMRGTVVIGFIIATELKLLNVLERSEDAWPSCGDRDAPKRRD
ncbi:hypothetical protein DL93DRAFT_2097171 [Clavulina sp. PMI_390]|nr:hypothetical protein DL93DRAFT_2097171 [Clavulina sp. PMI_390]